MRPKALTDNYDILIASFENIFYSEFSLLLLIKLRKIEIDIKASNFHEYALETWIRADIQSHNSRASHYISTFGRFFV